MITIIPAIDLIDGQCVRLTRGEYATAQLCSSDPVATAIDFERHGVKRLHVVDLDGARAGHIVNGEVLRRIATATALTIDFGGGVRTAADAGLAFACGAQMITAGSIAVRDPGTVLGWLERFGAERILLGADFSAGRIAVSGWQEKTQQNLEEFIAFFYDRGVRQAVCTDIERDGMLQGPALEAYVRLKERFPDLQLIASGGVAAIEDIARLEAAGVAGVIIGKALYEGRVTFAELEPWLC
ncbi:MAG TPA: 1-(5-phosphoribosyl)-5-[(5-phosphoribosylamino)methylideneamino]imidazole-4-carboxamide isomerase [bacterium]|nr:1-(5-phosphoribosyl)-5-[(5-phosphoribosylamino)methylideneamino]imidazole-4-carboxamide isomerase [bacterium]HQG44943.1 1-(5-phosphoribosyl)-5-[(5-phosphoribosylamino)methylideneamino]imidazole-4-carboxamide isomerase [bacterium]HQI48323.1 1-(5-phosphoribosyl)-5-[(5-phosphoribosylamino)methylideneamino]imidazole-4-carboxamide isomerase [bacterium]HQJ64166.1 1-(5-phosphoribosyl)-5-[(5-phosphoribosylamino)methylideneamino]imidazole-4-carboxamide isomerase [bacterium]